MIDPAPYLAFSLRFMAIATALGALELIFAKRPPALLVVEVCACVASIVDPSHVWLPALIFVLRVMRNRRERFGLDGADQLQTIAWAALSVAAATPDVATKSIALAFLGVQTLLAYATAGVVKLRARAWRDGSALQVIIGKPMPRVLTRAVMVFELALPVLAFAAPRAGLVAAGVFHLASSSALGLSGFALTFLAAWPAVLFVAAFPFASH